MRMWIQLFQLIPFNPCFLRAIEPVDLTGGKSVYCFNEAQLKHAFDLYGSQDETGEQIRVEVERIETVLTRNQRASLAFVLIDHLNKTSELD
jgi:hypothetical protein